MDYQVLNVHAYYPAIVLADVLLELQVAITTFQDAVGKTVNPCELVRDGTYKVERGNRIHLTGNAKMHGAEKTSA